MVEYLFVGTLNRSAPYFPNARGEGLVVMRFDEATLTAERAGLADDIDNPTFLALNARGSACYATSEVFGWKEGVVSAYAVDPASGALSYINKQPTLGSIAAFVEVGAGGQHLLVANYAMGEGGPDQALAVFPLAANGAIGPASGSIALSGHGPDTGRQERSHAHCARQMPDGTILVADLGTDCLHRYRLDGQGRPLPVGMLQLAPGAGPRHIAVRADGTACYAFNELNSTITTVACAADGSMRALGTVSSLPEGAEGSMGAEILISPDGRFVYASNRGHDSIAVFAADAHGLTTLGHVASGGRTPRNFTITPSGRHLLIANQDSDEIAIFSRDAQTGMPADTGRRIPVTTPMCVKVSAAG